MQCSAQYRIILCRPLELRHPGAANSGHNANHSCPQIRASAVGIVSAVHVLRYGADTSRSTATPTTSSSATHLQLLPPKDQRRMQPRMSLLRVLLVALLFVKKTIAGMVRDAYPRAQVLFTLPTRQC